MKHSLLHTEQTPRVSVFVISIFSVIVLVLSLGWFAQPQSIALAATGCVSSTPASGAYTATLCITTPLDGSRLSANVTVTGTVSVTGTNPGVQRFVFYLDNAYLLTDYQSPYTFVLPTTNWVDGAHTLSLEALMRDGYTTANRASVGLTFNNGVTTPPVNNNAFTPSHGTTPGQGAPLIVAAAGDGASGEVNSGKVVSLIAGWNPNLFLYLGDVYEKGSYTEFYNWYGNSGQSFSQFTSITNPTIGNHEYSNSSKGAGYFFYWNNVPNYYSYTIAGWHFISLNSNQSKIPLKAGSSEYNWLAQDLAANTAPCTLVYYHHPFFNVGPEGSTTQLSDIWNLMAQNHVTLVVNGHDHDYQRWTALNAAGNPDPHGITQIIAGTAGHGNQQFITTDSRMLVGFDASPNGYGALRLELSPSSAVFKYYNINSVLLDSGTIACQGGGGGGPTPTPTFTPLPPTATPTRTPLPPTATPTVSGPTNTPTPTLTGPTNTPLPPTNTPTPQPPTNTPTRQPPTNTPLPPTNTPTPAPPTNTPTPQPPTNTPTPAPTATDTPVVTSFTFTPQADAYVDSSNPTSNFGTSKTLYVDGSPVKNSYIRFNVSGLSGPIKSATLKVFANSTSTSGYSVQSVADNSWGETTINYSNAPAPGATVGSSGAIKTSGSWVSVNVASLVSGNGQVSVVLTTTSGTQINNSSRESGANAPQLVVQQ